VAGTKASEWTLFVYQGDRPNRAQLAAQLEVAPGSLVMMTLDDEPLEAEEDTAPSTGDALLDQVLAICAAKRVALSFDPKAMAALPGSPWKDPKSAKNWKEGAAAREILKRGPPEGWRQVEYQRTSRRGGRASAAWVPDGAEPRAAIALALSIAPDEIRLLGGEPEEAASARRHWRRPHIVEAVPDELVGSLDCTGPDPMSSEVDPGPKPDTVVPPAFAKISKALPAEGAAV
jgi:hypothetical protein